MTVQDRIERIENDEWEAKNMPISFILRQLMHVDEWGEDSAESYAFDAACNELRKLAKKLGK